MKFLVQKENKEYSLDNHILVDLIKNKKYIHSYKDWNSKQFYDKNKNLLPKEKLTEIKDYIPLGDIPFTETYFKIFHDIEQEMPIEIPLVLRTPEFLKRDYHIYTIEKIPKKGRYFIKDVSQLKTFSYCGELEYLFYDEIFDKPKDFDTRIHLNKNHLFQVSEIVDILSEYRIFVLDNEIYSIANYNGDVTLFPDMNLVRKAINLWSIQKDCPKSYSMDVAITKQGTLLLECHILFSTGIYNTVLGSNFLYGYQDAKDYLLNYNTPIKVF